MKQKNDKHVPIEERHAGQSRRDIFRQADFTNCDAGDLIFYLLLIDEKLSVFFRKELNKPTQPDLIENLIEGLRSFFSRSQKIRISVRLRDIEPLIEKYKKGEKIDLIIARKKTNPPMSRETDIIPSHYTAADAVKDDGETTLRNIVDKTMKPKNTLFGRIKPGKATVRRYVIVTNFSAEAITNGEVTLSKLRPLLVAKNLRDSINNNPSVHWAEMNYIKDKIAHGQFDLLKEALQEYYENN